MMADILPEIPDDAELFPDDEIGIDGETAWRIAEKVIEMIDRVKTADKFVPGAVAKLGVEVDGERFEISLRREPTT